MKVTVENKKGLNKDLKIFIDKETMNSYMDEKYEEIKGTVNLKGFRPGKVPKEILKRQFGKAVFGEVLDKVLKDTSTKALEEKKIKPAGQPKLDLKTYGEDKELEYVLSVTELPKVEIKSLENIKFDEYTVKIDDSETDKRIKEIAKNQPNFKEGAADTKAKEGDLVALDYKATIDGKEFKGSEGKNTQLTLGKDLFLKGFDKLGYKEHLDYDLVESSNPAFGKSIVRINVTRNHRQTIQYILPQHHERAATAELLVIDEAAAIPLPTVKALLGPYLVFLCSTINGYEGTGRALSIKLIGNLRREASSSSSGQQGRHGKNNKQNNNSIKGGSGRLLREVQLSEPCRYAPGDRIESWLNQLLCLDAADALPPLINTIPPPSACELYEVSRDTLFSAHKASEQFLKRMMALYVSSHYKNTPDDLQLMSDAPAHRLYVLLAPVNEQSNALPEILCVLQVALEGAISKVSARATLAAGSAPSGDLIPWTISGQFQDDAFPGLTLSLIHI